MNSFNVFDLTNYQGIEEGEYSNESRIILNDSYNSPIEGSCDFSYESRREDTLRNLFGLFPSNNENFLLNERSISSPNETDKNLSQKNTSDKSSNNSNNICNDQEIKSNLNESNENNNSSSINQEAIVSTNTKSQKGPFKITKERKLGRKRRNCCQKGFHNKYSYDNMTKKLKQLLINSILNYVNTSLIIEEEKDTSNQKRKKNTKWKVNSIPTLVKIDQNIIGNIKVEYNINLLRLQLKEILSKDITSKIKKLGKDYNKKIIDEVYLNNKKEKTINILNMTLLQCIEHLTQKEYYYELQGLENEYENIINKLKNSGETDEYIELFEDLFGRFEEYYKNKRKKKPYKRGNKVKNKR